MKIKQLFTYYVLLLSLILIISGCGTNSPTTNMATNKQVNFPVNTNITNPTVSAYMSSVHGNVITHEAINLLLNKGNLTEKQKQILVLYRDKIESGAILEDDGIRPKNHFWDPIHNTPLTDFGDFELNYNNQTAKNWFLDGDSFMLASAKTQFQQGIPLFDPVNPSNIPYIYKADVFNSMSNLGHIVHVLQDMTSIPHTRNDAHPPVDFAFGVPANQLGLGSSGYEELTYTNYNYSNLAKLNNIEFINEANLLAKYQQLTEETNQNFLSEDTIPNPNNKPSRWRTFASPTVPQITLDIATGNVIGGQLGYYPNVSAPLVYIKLNPDSKQIEYKLDDIVHTYYADVLMPKAVSYTAGVIRYFLSLKGTGELIIDNPLDYTTVYVPSADISGYLTYYAASATVYYHAAGTWSREHIEVPVTYDISTGRYVFSTANNPNNSNNPISLISGDNLIEVVADNENVTATTAHITITYNPGGGDDHDDNEEWWDDD